MNTNQTLIRAKDIGLLIAIITLIGMLIGPLRKSFQWDEAVNKVNKLEEKVISQSQDMAVIKSNLETINKQLESISWQIRRINR